jgi:Glycosyltransferase
LNLLKAWKGKAAIHFVCLAKEQKDYQYIERYAELFQDVKVFWQPKWRSLVLCLLGLIAGRSLQSSYCWNSKLARYLRDLNLSSFDVIYIKRLRMAQYATHLPADKVWIDLTDSMALHYSRMVETPVPLVDRAIAFYEKRFLGDCEREVTRTYRTIFCSKVDRSYACDGVTNESAAVTIPNAVDLSEFACVNHAPSSEPVYEICYWGNLNVQMNVTAVEILLRDILPELVKKSPNIRLAIIGPNPPKRFKRKYSGPFVFTGHVERLNTKLSNMDLFVCPLIFGTGVKNKVLQSLALGLPVLTTTIGVEGIEGIEEMVKQNIVFIEDDLSLYPDLIISLSKRKLCGERQAREFIRANYSIDCLRGSLVKNQLM